MIYDIILSVILLAVLLLSLLAIFYVKDLYSRVNHLEKVYCIHTNAIKSLISRVEENFEKLEDIELQLDPEDKEWDEQIIKDVKDDLDDLKDEISELNNQYIALSNKDEKLLEYIIIINNGNDSNAERIDEIEEKLNNKND